MFEKEAEEYVNEHSEYDETFDMVFVNCETKKAFQDGAEFGYNKANEWHYVSKKDYPKDKTEKKYLVALKSEYTNNFFFEIDIWCKSLHCFASNNPKNVYAWKEIVLPELKEIE